MEIQVTDKNTRLIFEAVCIEGECRNKKIKGLQICNNEFGTSIFANEWLEVDPATVKIIFADRKNVYPLR